MILWTIYVLTILKIEILENKSSVSKNNLEMNTSKHDLLKIN